MGCCASSTSANETQEQLAEAQKHGKVKDYKPRDFKTETTDNNNDHTPPSEPEQPPKVGIVEQPQIPPEPKEEPQVNEPPKEEPEEKPKEEAKENELPRHISPELTNQYQSFSGLYRIFSLHATDNKMDIDGLTAAMKEFGLMIDANKSLRKHIWRSFDLEDIGEIDYNDFSATMATFIDHQNEDSAFLIFQIFDSDDSGYLNVRELAKMLLAQHTLAAAVTNRSHIITSETDRTLYNKAKKFVTENDDNGDGKISFDEYNMWRKANFPV